MQVWIWTPAKQAGERQCRQVSAEATELFSTPSTLRSIVSISSELTYNPGKNVSFLESNPAEFISLVHLNQHLDITLCAKNTKAIFLLSAEWPSLSATHFPSRCLYPVLSSADLQSVVPSLLSTSVGLTYLASSEVSSCSLVLLCLRTACDLPFRLVLFGAGDMSLCLSISVCISAGSLSSSQPLMDSQEGVVPCRW